MNKTSWYDSIKVGFCQYSGDFKYVQTNFALNCFFENIFFEKTPIHEAW